MQRVDYTEYSNKTWIEVDDTKIRCQVTNDIDDEMDQAQMMMRCQYADLMMPRRTVKTGIDDRTKQNDEVGGIKVANDDTVIS